MSISVVFQEIEFISNEFFDKNEVNLDKQKMLDLYGIYPERIGMPKTKIEKTSDLKDFLEYHVTISTETIKKPIYIYNDGYVEYNKGYQEIEQFDFWIKKDKSLIILFTPKAIANLFLRRLKQHNYLKTKPIIFDFSKIDELENMDSAWGVWEDSQGIVRRIAKFGKGITEEINDYSVITTFYIDYYYGEDCLNLILSKNGRLSTKNNIKKEDIFIIFNEILPILKKK